MLLGMRYAAGPDGSRGFSIGRGMPLPGSLPPLAKRVPAAEKKEDHKKDREKPPLLVDVSQRVGYLDDRPSQKLGWSEPNRRLCNAGMPEERGKEERWNQTSPLLPPSSSSPPKTTLPPPLSKGLAAATRAPPSRGHPIPREK